LAAQLSEFRCALAEALDSIALLADTVAPAESFDCERCHWSRGVELCRGLRRLLASNDFVPHELTAELVQSAHCRLLRTQLQELQRHVDRIDYAAALALLDRIVCVRGHDFSGRGEGSSGPSGSGGDAD
jgi:hypothetical protein